MSVGSLLAGMMPPQDDENPLPLPWQPIPVSIIPADRDYVSEASISDNGLAHHMIKLCVLNALIGCYIEITDASSMTYR